MLIIGLWSSLWVWFLRNRHNLILSNLSTWRTLSEKKNAFLNNLRKRNLTTNCSLTNTNLVVLDRSIFTRLPCAPCLCTFSFIVYWLCDVYDHVGHGPKAILADRGYIAEGGGCRHRRGVTLVLPLGGILIRLKAAQVFFFCELFSVMLSIWKYWTFRR